MAPWVIMRARNDMPVITQTLAKLGEQDHPFRLIVFDNASTDGTTEEAGRHADLVVDVPAGTYVPGRVLNQAMEVTDGERVVFLNSDCTPVDARWLSALLGGLTDDRVAAVFGRQVPRPGCHPLLARDIEATYGDGQAQASWRHCFSMASSAIRRSAWQRRPFNENLQYSEDIEWTWQARQMGFEVRYVPDSAVEHSHNYTLRQFYGRHYGEGRAEAAIFDWSPWERTWLRYALLPYGRQVLSDVTHALAHGLAGAALYAPLLRGAQLLGRRAGFRDGLRRWGADE